MKTPAASTDSASHFLIFEIVSSTNSFDNPGKIIEHLKNVGEKWIKNQGPDDDVTFIVIKVK